jgi:hypothetical protein
LWGIGRMSTTTYYLKDKLNNYVYCVATTMKMAGKIGLYGEYDYVEKSDRIA